MRKNQKKVFVDGIFSVLEKLVKEKKIFSFTFKEKYFEILFSENEEKTLLHFAYSKHYTGSLVPKSFLLKKGYVFNKTNFCIAAGSAFADRDIISLEKLLRSEARNRRKGFLSEKKFKGLVETIIDSGDLPGLLSLVKTDSLQEQNGQGDFILVFDGGLKLHIDIKSSDFGVRTFYAKRLRSRWKKIVIAINVTPLSKNTLLSKLRNIYTMAYPQSVRL